MKIVIMLPAYNEEGSLHKVISRWRKCCPEGIIVVCDNGSLDNTFDIALRYSDMVFKEYIKGKGAAVKKILRNTDADVYVMCDADDTYMPTERVITPVLEDKYDLVVGNRKYYFNKHHGLFNGLGNRISNIICKDLLHVNIKDPLSGLRCFNKRFLKGLKLKNNFEIEAQMARHCYLHKNLRVGNVDINYKLRVTGVSKLNAFTDGLGILKSFLC